MEFEVRFLGVNKDDIVSKLISLGAKDCGEQLLREIIFYDKARLWQKEQMKFVRVRTSDGKSSVTFKQSSHDTSQGVREVQFAINPESVDGLTLFLDELGIEKFREQEKKRHKFIMGDFVFDIDTWPSIPSYLEIEALEEAGLKQAANLLGLDWNNAQFHDAKWVIEEVYNVPVGRLRSFTFNKIE